MSLNRLMTMWSMWSIWPDGPDSPDGPVTHVLQDDRHRGRVTDCGADGHPEHAGHGAAEAAAGADPPELRRRRMPLSSTFHGGREYCSTCGREVVPTPATLWERDAR